MHQDFHYSSVSSSQCIACMFTNKLGTSIASISMLVQEVRGMHPRAGRSDLGCRRFQRESRLLERRMCSLFLTSRQLEQQQQQQRQ